MVLPALYVYGGSLCNERFTKRDFEKMQYLILYRFSRQLKHPAQQAQVPGHQHRRPLVVRPPILTTLEAWDEKNGLVSRTDVSITPAVPPQPDARGHSSSPLVQPSSDAGNPPLSDNFDVGGGPIDLYSSDDELAAQPDDFVEIEDKDFVASIDNSGPQLFPARPSRPSATLSRLESFSSFLQQQSLDSVCVFLAKSNGDFFNSLPSAASPSFVARLNGVQQAAASGSAECPRQMNGDDCGVAVVVNAMYILAARPLPASEHCDFSLWRQVFVALLVEDEAVTTFLLPKYFPEPTVTLVE
ncbi:hypothetical protein BKA59DRAFT_515861 [Fusarium tricinctum]|uniref:Uncharacterized protein n=1 Tax=Fusarium tricinctum TaxID=61284 RepID=A0A8K0RQB4_9HYPO|nr:hypothetical protein BKA59DRAFT_515861 [Fusarium tricinctum]